MLRGAIEEVTAASVTGWICETEGNVRDLQILAFVDNTCVGAGEVSLYRKDLFDAGLGDGFLGFRFPIDLPSPDDAGRVVVRLDWSDAVLLPPGGRVVTASSIDTKPALVAPRKAPCLRWMLGHGLLEQGEFDFLTFLDQHGAYERVVTLSKVQKASGRSQQDVEEVARQLMELHYMMEISIETSNVDDFSDLRELFAGLQPASGADTVVCLHSSERGKIGIVEGSHRDGDKNLLNAQGAIDYAIGPDRLLMLNVNCVIEPRLIAPSATFNVYFAAEQP